MQQMGGMGGMGGAGGAGGMDFEKLMAQMVSCDFKKSTFLISKILGTRWRNGWNGRYARYV